MIHKTSELFGTQLSYAVSLITNPEWDATDRWANTIGYVDSGIFNEEPYYPHDIYDLGAKIMNDEHIGTMFQGGKCIAFYLADESDLSDFDFKLSAEGQDMLQAGMRCFITKHIGNTVEIPETSPLV
jgi:Protein of unknown function (DUF2591)